MEEEDNEGEEAKEEEEDDDEEEAEVVEEVQMYLFTILAQIIIITDSTLVADTSNEFVAQVTHNIGMDFFFVLWKIFWLLLFFLFTL